MGHPVEIDPQAVYVCASFLHWEHQVRGSKGDLYTVTWNAAVAAFTCTCIGNSEFHKLCYHIRDQAQPMYCGWSQVRDEGEPLKYIDQTLRCPRCRGHIEVLSVEF